MSSIRNRRTPPRLEVLEGRSVPAVLVGPGSSVVLSPADPAGPWQPDRYAPAAFTPGQPGGGRVGVLDEFISAGDKDGSRPPAYNYGFYDFQGGGYDLAAGTTYLSADLYVPASWSGLSQQDPSGNQANWGSLASLWAKGVDASGNVASYPIIGFNNQAGSGTGGFQVFDQTNGWTDVQGFTGADQWYQISFGIHNGAIDYFVNGQPVYHDATATGTTTLSNVILQGYNGGNDYHISWDNLRNTQDPNRAFVLGLYQDLLGRDGSTDAGVGTWVDLLKGGAGRGDVVMGVLNSTEYRGREVDHFYQAFLGREADAAGRAGWISYLQQGGTEEGMAVGFLTSAEYQAKFPDDASFVRSLYDQLLFRGASDAEAAGWVNVLNGGASRADVVRGFLHSREASLRAVDAVYAGFLRREAEPAGREGFTDQLQQADGKAIDVMLAALASNEYYGRCST